MKSIEIINKYIKNYKETLTSAHNLKIIEILSKKINEMELVKKDLEVLPILKRIVKIVDYSNHPATSVDDQLVILSGGTIKNIEDYDKIKKWLEEDK